VIEIIDGGLRTTVQDNGRTGSLARGFPPSGAQDPFAFRMGNLLVGNDIGGPFFISEESGDAGLEIEVYGLKAKFLDEHVIAITGGDLGAKLNGDLVPMWEALEVYEHDIITFGYPKSGLRSYLTIAGGVFVPEYLGSKSTFLRGSVGGYQGRPVQKGDVLQVSEAKTNNVKLAGRKLEKSVIPVYGREWEFRVIMGPQDDLFVEKSREDFLNEIWKISPKSDRMGMRLYGPKLDFKPRPDYLIRDAGSDPSNIVEDAIPIGGIQVPSGLELIVMGVDGPSMGGFAKIATVILADMSRMAQARPGDTVKFIPISIYDAVDVLRGIEEKISEKYVYGRS
jgi:biotin-dependent carboxylase-like uncharacterized protein